MFKRLVLKNPPGRYQQWLHTGASKPSGKAVNAVANHVVDRLRDGLHDSAMAMMAKSWFATAQQTVPEASEDQCVAFAVHKTNVLWEEMLRTMGKLIVRNVEHPTLHEPDWATTAG
jgi:hypothetical protein